MFKTTVIRNTPAHATPKSFRWEEVKKNAGIYRTVDEAPGSNWKIVTTGRSEGAMVSLFVNDSGVIENANDACYAHRTFVLDTESLTIRFEN